MRSRDFYGCLAGFEKVWAVEFSPRGACCSPYATRENLAKYRPQGTKIPICREFMRSMLSRVTYREYLVIDRESNDRPHMGRAVIPYFAALFAFVRVLRSM